MPGSMGRSRGDAIDDSVFDEEYNNYRPATSNLTADYPSGDYGNGKHHGNPLAKAAGAVKGTVSDVAGEIKDRVSDVTGEIKDRVSDMTGDIKDRVSDVKHELQDRVEGTGQDVRDRMGSMRSDMRDRMGNMAGDTRGRMGEMSDEAQYRMQKAGYRMEEWQQRARYEGQRRGEQLARNLEDNPLIYGAVALAAGAALALLLPSTRTESRFMGEMRDEIMDRGREVLDTAKSRAQEVVSEIRPELEEKARQVVSDAKEMGKEIVKDAAAEMRPVVDKAVSKTKEEAKNLAQEAGINAEKMGGASSGSGLSGSSSSGMSTSGSGSVGAASIGTPTSSTTMGTGSATTTAGKPVVNRDTLRGQWTQLKGEVKSRWGQLTDDELTRIEGDSEKLIGALQTRYGYARGRAEQEVNDWFNSRKV
jgi:uncharacterized protein YjbJ (UPF0337 family)/vacuolar-type H+-ATPase subunit H